VKQLYSPSLAAVILCFVWTFPLNPLQAQTRPVLPPPLPPPRPLPLPSLPSPAPPPLNLPPLPTPAPDLEAIPGTIHVQKFRFAGNTVISTQDLERVVAPYTGKELSFDDLLKARDAVTNLYIERGYITSRARVLEVPANFRIKQAGGAVVTLQIIEGKIEAINITGSSRIRNYVRSRLRAATSPVLNVNRLSERLWLLQVDPLIKEIAVQLTPGTHESTRILTAQVEAAPPGRAAIFLNNNRSPAVGSLERGVQLDGNSLLRVGDRFSLTYRNTTGSNQEDVRITIPFNRSNGTVQLAFSNVNSRVVQEPFSQLDLTSAARAYNISLRQPVIRQATARGTQELAVGVAASRQESETTWLDTQYPLSAGADAQGKTRISALRLFQEYAQRGSKQVLFARSQFSFGIGALDATVNPRPPDSNFFSWQGQSIWLRSLSNNMTLLTRGGIQLADRPLVPLEQFVVGGATTVRGYREQGFLGNNGLLASVEVGVPLLSTQRFGTVRVVPFLDAGVVWGSTGSLSPSSQTLFSTGVGLEYNLSDQLSARLDAALPLITFSEPESEWRGNTFSFQINYELF